MLVQCDVLTGHTSAIIAISGITVGLGTIVATSSVDSTVRILNCVSLGHVCHLPFKIQGLHVDTGKGL